LYYFSGEETQLKEGINLLFIFAFLTPIIAICFFINCVTLAKKIKNGDTNTANNTGWGAVMFGFIVFSLIWSSLMLN
jgi:ABC-type nickel/cobalt efflux system permease component RcnA